MDGTSDDWEKEGEQVVRVPSKLFFRFFANVSTSFPGSMVSLGQQHTWTRYRGVNRPGIYGVGLSA